MDHDLARRAAAESRALRAALAIAGKALWSFERPGPALSTPFANYLYVSVAELLLVPTTAGLPFASRLADRAMREARSDALVVAASTAENGLPRVLFALGKWSSSGTAWSVPVWPWLSRDHGLWFLPSTRLPHVHAWPLRQCRVRSEPSPWSALRDLDAGRARAISWLDQFLT